MQVVLIVQAWSWCNFLFQYSFLFPDCRDVSESFRPSPHFHHSSSFSLRIVLVHFWTNDIYLKRKQKRHEMNIPQVCNEKPKDEILWQETKNKMKWTKLGLGVWKQKKVHNVPDSKKAEPKPWNDGGNVLK